MRPNPDEEQTGDMGVSLPLSVLLELVLLALEQGRLETAKRALLPIIAKIKMVEADFDAILVGDVQEVPYAEFGEEQVKGPAINSAEWASRNVLPAVPVNSDYAPAKYPGEVLE